MYFLSMKNLKIIIIIEFYTNGSIYLFLGNKNGKY